MWTLNTAIVEFKFPWNAHFGSVDSFGNTICVCLCSLIFHSLQNAVDTLDTSIWAQKKKKQQQQKKKHEKSQQFCLLIKSATSFSVENVVWLYAKTEKNTDI